MTTDARTRAHALTVSLRVQLQTEGYRPTLIDAAIRRALGAATEKARPISAAIYDQAFLDLLTAELRGVRSWIEREQQLVQR